MNRGDVNESFEKSSCTSWSSDDGWVRPCVLASTWSWSGRPGSRLGAAEAEEVEAAEGLRLDPYLNQTLSQPLNSSWNRHDADHWQRHQPLAQGEEHGRDHHLGE